MKNTRTNSSKISVLYKNVRKKTRVIQEKTMRLIEKRPLLSFFGMLFLLVLVIAVGSSLRKAKNVEESKSPATKNVAVYNIGSSPKIQFTGTVDKTGTIKIIAQSAGVVQQINFLEGTRVYKGQTLFWLSSNYQGGNIQSVSRQIAQKSYETVESNYPLQQEMLAKRRELAVRGDSQAIDFRNITKASIESTKSLLALNDEIKTTIDANLALLEATNVGGVNDAVILQTKSSKAGVVAAINSLQAGLRTSEYTSSDTTEPAALSTTSKDLTLKQLEVEQKALDLNREISGLNLKIAQISESFMYPAAPAVGVIEKIHVSIGQNITPGTLLATMTADKNVANVTVLVSGAIARQLSRIEKSTLSFGATTIEMTPRYISTEPTDGMLHSVIYTLPQEVGKELSEAATISVAIPVGEVKSMASVPYIPIDAVYQTQDQAIVYIATASGSIMNAASRNVKLGNVIGSLVEITQGITLADQVIVNRNVIDGDLISIIQ